jgi:hypothetical protein
MPHERASKRESSVKNRILNAVVEIILQGHPLEVQVLSTISVKIEQLLAEIDPP